MKPDDPLLDPDTPSQTGGEPLQEALATLRYRGKLPAALPAQLARPASWLERAGPRWAIAAALLLGLGLAVAWNLRSRPLDHLASAPRLAWEFERNSAGDAHSQRGLLGVGEWLRTDERTHAQLDVADIGELDVHPNSALQLIASSPTEHRLRLEQGRVKARVNAPPRLFLVETPAALAVDLGCAYELIVDEGGDGSLAVYSGWVALERQGRESRVPAGAQCAMRRASGPGTPHRTQASDDFKAALTSVDFGGDTSALAGLLAQASEHDALTLWHLLPRVSEPERAQVYDRMVELIDAPQRLEDGGPPTDTATLRTLTLALNAHALEAWWKEIE